jgi:hypothetical protein
VITPRTASDLVRYQLSSARELARDKSISSISTDLVKLKYTSLVKMMVKRTEKLGFLNGYRPQRGPVIAGLCGGPMVN